MSPGLYYEIINYMFKLRSLNKASKPGQVNAAVNAKIALELRISLSPNAKNGQFSVLKFYYD